MPDPDIAAAALRAAIHALHPASEFICEKKGQTAATVCPPRNSAPDTSPSAEMLLWNLAVCVSAGRITRTIGTLRRMRASDTALTGHTIDTNASHES